LIKQGVCIALEIEDITRVNFMDFVFRLKACVAKKFGCYSFVYKFISWFVWLYLGVKSRVNVFFVCRIQRNHVGVRIHKCVGI
jgi:hypothetical protein